MSKTVQQTQLELCFSGELTHRDFQFIPLTVGKSVIAIIIIWLMVVGQVVSTEIAVARREEQCAFASKTFVHFLYYSYFYVFCLVAFFSLSFSHSLSTKLAQFSSSHSDAYTLL